MSWEKTIRKMNYDGEKLMNVQDFIVNNQLPIVNKIINMVHSNNAERIAREWKTLDNEIKELEGHYDMMQQQFQAIRDMMGGM